MEIKKNTLQRELIDYRLEPSRLEDKRFVDFTHNVTGKMCIMYYNPRTKRYELEPIEKNG